MSKSIDERIFELAREVVCKLRQEAAAGVALTPLKIRTLAELETEIGRAGVSPRRACPNCPGCAMAPVKKTLH